MKYLVKYKKEMRQKLLNYLKIHDMETALNVLFVLSDERQNLPQICHRMTIDKELFVQMAFLSIQLILKK